MTLVREERSARKFLGRHGGALSDRDWDPAAWWQQMVVRHSETLLVWIMPAYCHGQEPRVQRPSRCERDRRRMDRRSGYFCERWTIRDSREWICRQATGRTLEVGFGTGLNTRWYPRDVELVAVDLDPERLAVSLDRARRLDRLVHIAVADGQRLPFNPDTFETVICTLAICDVHDREAILAEAYRVIRPAGSLLLLDHVEPRWRHGRPAKLGEQVGFVVAERQRLWGGYFERARLQKRAACESPPDPR